MDREYIVAAVVRSAGGTLIGRVRLQKIVYLLDRLGLNSGFGYEYYHFGPYSRDLDNATADAKAFSLLNELHEHRQSDGAMYSIFQTTPNVRIEDSAYGQIGPERARELAQLFARTNVTVLELAATVDWLWREERCANWRNEVTRRKGIKVRNGRLDRAIELLQQLGVAPPAIPAGT